MTLVKVWIGSQGPYLSQDKGLRTDKAPADQYDVIRLADVGGLVGFKKVAVSGQGDLVADGAGQTLTLVGCTGLTLTTDPLTDTLTLTLAFGTGVGQVCQGNDSRLSDARTPTAHAASHAPGGSDPVAFVITD